MNTNISAERLTELIANAAGATDEAWWLDDVADALTELQSLRAALEGGEANEADAYVDWTSQCVYMAENIKDPTGLQPVWFRAASLPKEAGEADKHLWVMEEIAANLLTGDRSAATKLREAIDFFTSAKAIEPSTSDGEAVCQDCKRHVMVVPEPATGWIAKCGKRLTRLSECGSGIECAASPQPAPVVTDAVWQAIAPYLRPLVDFAEVREALVAALEQQRGS